MLIDFTQAGYIDSSGLGALVSLGKRIREQGGELRLAGLNEDLRTLFELTRLDTLFHLYGTAPILARAVVGVSDSRHAASAQRARCSSSGRSRPTCAASMRDRDSRVDRLVRSPRDFRARQCRLNIPVALTEALSNAIIAATAVTLARGSRDGAHRRCGRSCVEVTDEGIGFDLAAARAGRR